MKTKVTGVVHQGPTKEVTKNGKTIGHLVLLTGEGGEYGPEYLAVKVLGKSAESLRAVKRGNTVSCMVDVKSNEAKDGSRWYTDAVAFGVRVEDNQGSDEGDEEGEEMPPIDGDDSLPF